MKKLFFLLFATAVAITVNSCNEDSNNSNTESYTYNVHMTDAPGPYEEVNIDLQGVEVTGKNGQSVLLNTNDGVYNLLDLTNGTNILIASSVLNDADVKQIRLILGPNSTVVVGGVTYPLSTPSAEQTGLKLLVNQTLQADIQNEILIDFDANTSIIQTGNGSYKLKPVLRTVVTALTGSITGSVIPIDAFVLVSATSETNVEYTSYLNNLGAFKISGLPPGAYTFIVRPTLPLIPIIQSNVIVVAGETTALGALTIW